MRALVLEEAGAEPRLVVREMTEPQVGPRDVLVRVEACGICYHDVAVMQGLLRRGVKKDIVLGHEISGVVAQVGPGVSAAKVGDQVATILTEPCGSCERCLAGREHRCLQGRGIGHGIDGGFAEVVRVHENAVVVLPEGVELETACILGCPMGVALEALRDRARLQPGETCLVTGAGGGLGLHALQFTKALGARTLAVTSSPEKVARLEAFQPDEVLLAGELDFGELALALTADRGVEVVVNTVGAVMFDGCFRALAPYGRMLLLGEVVGQKISLNPAQLVFKDAQLIGSAGTSKRNLLEAAQMVAQGLVRPVISRSYALEEVGEAYRAMLNRETFGRVVVKPQG